MNKILKNSFWIAICNVLDVVCSFFLYMYISRTIGVSNLGKYSYIASIVNYFVLLSGLGISSYAIREGTLRRNDKRSFNEFISEIFSLNVIFTFLSYLLFVCVAVVFKSALNNHMILLVIYSITIMCVPFDMEWMYSIAEDFELVAIRSVLVNLVNFIFVLLFVRNENDIIKYVLIMTVLRVLITTYNYVHARKIVRFHLSFDLKELKKHLMSVSIIFFTTITINLYAKSDITLLGIMTTDYDVGLYSNAVKIYSIIDSFIASLAIASYPRIASQSGNEAYQKKVSGMIMDLSLFIVLPIATGLFFLSKEVILIVSGKNYLGAKPSLELLSIALIINILNWFWTRCIIFPHKLEMKMLIIAVVAGVSNVVLNILVIPYFGIVGAAITTIIAELITTIGYNFVGIKYLDRVDFIFLINIVLGCIGEGGAILFVKKMIESYLYVPLSIMAGATIYLAICGLAMIKKFEKLKVESRCNIDDNKN
ncbi:oligosaccharide flippase family protein [Butyrivibrio hungatei]|uniref:oligosaccharide flippase family protein n=1 Tax=Butyrivibrio hungatei TaxID=185008 RepID=UPI0008DC03AA|nr:oligosaccharide flippase family protein [Butyrivibrio hungatei]